MSNLNLNKVKLIAIDIDGTLLSSARVVPAENASAIAEARRQGVTIALSSGRIRPSIVPFAKELGITDGPFVCSNGAHIVGSDGSTLQSFTLSEEVKNAVVDFAIASQLHLHAYATDEMFFLEENRWSEMYRARAKSIPSRRVSLDELRAGKYIKMMVIGEPERIQNLLPDARSTFSALPVTLTESEPEYLEFLPGHVSKGFALEILCQSLGIDQHEVAAIGDYLNDLEMIEWAGVGIAMGNAIEAVKQVANRVAPTNDEAGVAWAIQSVLT